MNDFVRRYRIKAWRFFVQPFANRKFVRTPALYESIVSADPKKLFVATSAFNDPELVAMQYRALKKFLQDPYEYFVCDNSSKEEKAEEIRKFCTENKINYLRLPFNVGNQRRDAGVAHGLAINWIYRNVIERFKPAEFGFWDFDLFPVRPVRVSDYLAVSDAWGIFIRRRPRLEPWSYPLGLWVGLMFWRLERFKDSTPNFLPTFGVDTGERIRLSAKTEAALPGILNFPDWPLVEIAPGVKVRPIGDGFVHFEGSSMGPLNALEVKKRWMENIINKS